MEENINGLEDFQKKLSELQKKAKALDGENKISFNELFPVDFMKHYTKFQSIDDMMSAGGIVSNLEEINLETNLKWNTFVSKYSNFDDWNSMIDKAASQWITRQLGL